MIDGQTKTCPENPIYVRYLNISSVLLNRSPLIEAFAALVGSLSTGLAPDTAVVRVFLVVRPLKQFDRQ